jgi:hypothetical protein
MDVCGRLRLPRLANELLAFKPRRDAFGFLAQALCLFFEALIEWGSLFEIAPVLHGAAPFRSRKAGAQLAFSSPMKYRVPDGDYSSVRFPIEES